jgi:hypothetical protein
VSYRVTMWYNLFANIILFVALYELLLFENCNSQFKTCNLKHEAVLKDLYSFDILVCIHIIHCNVEPGAENRLPAIGTKSDTTFGN